VTGGVYELEPGTVVAERFEITCRLGAGGMGVVYEAVQRALARKVALKVLQPESAALPTARARFEREARVAATLRHPNAVEIYDFGLDGGLLYLAMERLTGATLRDALAGGPLSAEDLIDVGRQVASVLVEAHAIDLVHRDLKPGNIFLEEDYADGGIRVVVADFGLAFIRDHEDVGRMTREGVMTGTPAYVSPEQALGRDVGPASDVYSLGCTLFEGATGRPPFTDESEVAVITKHLFAHSPALREAGASAEVPHGVEVLLQGMLAKRPEERPSAAEAHEELRALGERLGTRERGRGEDPLLPRRDRMIPEGAVAAEAATVPGKAVATPASPAAKTRVAVRGALDESLLMGLAAAGLEAFEIERGEPLDGADAIYAPGASPEELARWSGARLAVVTDGDPADMERVAALLAAGVDEAVPRPVKAEELARRIIRALSRRTRRR